MPRTPESRTTSSGFALLPVGIVLTTLANTTQGWTQGLVLGAGITLILLSVVLLGASIGERRKQGQGWLPSRDGDG